MNAIKTSHRSPMPNSDAGLWLVVIDAKRKGMPFSKCITRAGALATVRQLRSRGIDARIIEPDELALGERGHT